MPDPPRDHQVDHQRPFQAFQSTQWQRFDPASRLQNAEKNFDEPYTHVLITNNIVDNRTFVIDCLAPASALRTAGIGIEGQDVYELANGQVVEYPYGFARISLMGSETVAQIIFGPEGCEPILGVVALENIGIGIDPVSRGLKRMAAKPLK